MKLLYVTHRYEKALSLQEMLGEGFEIEQYTKIGVPHCYSHNPADIALWKVEKVQRHTNDGPLIAVEHACLLLSQPERPVSLELVNYLGLSAVLKLAGPERRCALETHLAYADEQGSRVFSARYRGVLSAEPKTPLPGIPEGLFADHFVFKPRASYDERKLTTLTPDSREEFLRVYEQAHWTAARLKRGTAGRLNKWIEDKKR